MQKKFIVYEGQEFTIECYWNSNGKSSVLEYYEALDLEHKDKIFRLFKLMGDFGAIRNREKFNYEGDQIYAFKSAPNRFLCFFFEGSKIILTNAFEKKKDELPPREKEKALRYKSDYIRRVKGDDYYD